MSGNENDDTQPNYHFSFEGLQFTPEEASILIKGSPVKNKAEISKLQINISGSVKAYSKLYYTTSLDALGDIIRKQTIRSSSLA